MRDLFKLLLVGIVLFSTPQVFAGDYRVLVIPDNIVTENVSLDSYIYNASAEFFADEVSSILNTTDNITMPSVSETREAIKANPSTVIAVKNLTSRFKTSYNVDYVTLKKIATKINARYALLITSHIDAENYILRRTVWDFLNVAGATVIDPAYKISTYAVLVDTEKNTKLWSDTYYKTISACESRIMTRGASPQTEQLSRIKDYSRYLCPQIAQNVQINVLPADTYAKESQQIYYDIGNIDNVFTKKYRHIGKEYDKIYTQKKTQCGEFVEETKTKVNEIVKDTTQKIKDTNSELKQRRKEKKDAKLEVKATPLYQDSSEEINGLNNISNKKESKLNGLKNAIFVRKKTPTNTAEVEVIETAPTIPATNILEGLDIKKKKKNNLYGEIDTNRPELRDYYN